MSKNESMVKTFSKKVKRACSFIRELRVGLETGLVSRLSTYLGGENVVWQREMHRDHLFH